MTHGARNDIPATVTAIARGDVVAQLEGERVGTSYRMASVRTCDSPDEPGLREGDTVPVLARAVNVLLVKP